MDQKRIILHDYMKKISNMELRLLYKEPDVGALSEELLRAGHV